MSRISYVVRVVIFVDGNQESAREQMLIENLRYAGVITMHQTGMRTGTEKVVFDIHPPRHIPATMAKGWATSNAERMKSFGYNAECCPSTQKI